MWKTDKKCWREDTRDTTFLEEVAFEMVLEDCFQF